MEIYCPVIITGKPGKILVHFRGYSKIIKLKQFGRVFFLKLNINFKTSNLQMSSNLSKFNLSYYGEILVIRDFGYRRDFCFDERQCSDNFDNGLWFNLNTVSILSCGIAP